MDKEIKNKISKARNIIGVYKIENKLNNKIYIGSSKNIGLRWYSHINMLNNGKHHSKKFQIDWNETKSYDIFSFEVLQECEESELLIIEQYYIDKFNSFEEGYNSTRSYFGIKEDSTEDKMQIHLKFNKKKDSLIFKTILDCKNKADFIKNAIFYYIVAINKGDVIDRLYPYSNVRQDYNKIINKPSRTSN